MSCRFSSPVNSPSTAENWPVRPMTRADGVGLAGDVVAGDLAPSPPSAAMRVERMWTVVVLPAPFGPRSA